VKFIEMLEGSTVTPRTLKSSKAQAAMFGMGVTLQLKGTGRPPSAGWPNTALAAVASRVGYIHIGGTEYQVLATPTVDGLQVVIKARPEDVDDAWTPAIIGALADALAGVAAPGDGRVIITATPVHTKSGKDVLVGILVKIN